VRSVIAGGITLAGGLRRPAAPQSGRNPPAPRDLAAPPSPSRPRRKRAAAPVPPPRPARPGWLARWFGPNRPRHASPARPPFHNGDDTPFTPEAYPGLSPEACAIFNTPVEKCDPDILRLVLAALALHIANSMPPELGMTDAKAMFSTLWGHLGIVPGEAMPDARPAEEPAPAPAAPKDAGPDAPLLQAQRTEPTDDAIAARETPPDAASPTGPVFRPDRSLFDRSRSFRHRRRSFVLRCRARFRRSLPGWLQRPPPRRLCYAACAGPP